MVALVVFFFEKMVALVVRACLVLRHCQPYQNMGAPLMFSCCLVRRQIIGEPKPIDACQFIFTPNRGRAEGGEIPRQNFGCQIWQGTPGLNPNSPLITMAHL
jgi:hypothetical protein